MKHTCLGTEDGYIVRQYMQGYVYKTSGRLGRIFFMRGYGEIESDWPIQGYLSETV